MDVLILIARLSLAGVFALAGGTKLADQPGTRRAFSEFGLPEPLARMTAFLIPIAELGVAVALVLDSSSRVGAAGALLLLFVFTAAIAANLARGRTPDCHCFGQIASEPIGKGTLARNAALAAVAAAILLQGHGESSGVLVNWLEGASTAEAIALANGAFAVLLGCGVLWLLLQLVGQNGRIVARLDALEGGMSTGGAIAAVPAPLKAM